MSFWVTIDDPLPQGVTQVANQGTVASNELATVLTDDPQTAAGGDQTVTPVTAAPAMAATKVAVLAVDTLIGLFA